MFMRCNGHLESGEGCRHDIHGVSLLLCGIDWEYAERNLGAMYRDVDRGLFWLWYVGTEVVFIWECGSEVGVVVWLGL
jgi:hypothetical protein